MSWEWWQANIDGFQSMIYAICKNCEFVCNTSCIGNIVAGNGIPCMCTGNVLWTHEARRVQITTSFSETEVDTSEMTPIWWKENILGIRSRLRVICKICNTICTPTIGDYTCRGGIGCTCPNRTEAKLLKWLNEQFEEVGTQAGKCVNPTTERKLPFDFSVNNTFVELDGDIGHFGLDFLKQPCEDIPKRDLLKEKWAIGNGFSVIRVYQPHVWYDRVDWQGYLLQSFHALTLDATPRVITQNIPQYTSGIYAQLRTI
jgi:hypothetical protein